MAAIRDRTGLEKTKKDTSKNIAFRFQYIPHNGNYSFEHFRKDFRRKLSAYEMLHDKFCELTSKTLNEVRQIGKVTGGEQVPLWQFSDGLQRSLKNIPHVSEDTKLTIFRFGNNNYRLICVEDAQTSHILYIVAFDFDFTAYDHG